jgi:hypothetical protein
MLARSGARMDGKLGVEPEPPQLRVIEGGGDDA